MESSRILIDAIYTNQSGSKRLLEYLIKKLIAKGEIDQYFFLFDQRIESDVLGLIDPKRKLYIKPGELGRLSYYRQMPEQIKSIFCFGSVPPPIKLTNKTVTILQHNPFFFENPGYGLHLKFLYLLKRLYIWSRCEQSYQWIVQTPRIKELLIKYFKTKEKNIHIKPFFEIDFFDDPKSIPYTRPLKFVYPADGVPQKNHKYLFRVWERLKNDYQITPELHVTLPSKYTHHLQRIEHLKANGVNIINHGFITKSEVKALYHNAHFLIFPSMSESFGLPLAEAVSCGLKVIGSDMPYLYQVVKPSAVFDPKGEKSLIDLIIEIHRGKELPVSNVILKNHIEDVIKLIQPM